MLGDGALGTGALRRQLREPDQAEVSRALAVPSSGQGPSPAQPAGSAPPLPRHCPTCLSGAAPSPRHQVCSADGATGARGSDLPPLLFHPTPRNFHRPRATRLLAGTPGSRGSGPSAPRPARAGMDSGPRRSEGSGCEWARGGRERPDTT